jgi:hypothetical protein
MDRKDCTVGMKVYFGETLGQIKKLNPKRAKVCALETRGCGRSSAAGLIWSVPYSMLTPASQPLRYSQFMPQEDIHILQAIAAIYANLSPENLSCDGELSVAQVRSRQAEYERKLHGLFDALGRKVTESEIYEWERQRRAAFDASLVEN